MNSIVVEVKQKMARLASVRAGGAPACYIIEKHFKRFLIGQDPRNLNQMWDQMYRASVFYGGKGLPWALSVVDLALGIYWDCFEMNPFTR